MLPPDVADAIVVLSTAQRAVEDALESRRAWQGDDGPWPLGKATIQHAKLFLICRYARRVDTSPPPRPPAPPVRVGKEAAAGRDD